MKNADMPAMPQTITDSNDNSGLIGSHMEGEWQGLTKREMFAINALNGILSNSDYSYNGFHGAAELAVEASDALLKELDKDV